MTPEQVAEIYEAAFPDARPWTAAEIEKLIAAPGGFLVHVEEAFAIGRVTVDEAEIITLACRPEFQRRGLGARVLAEFEDTAVQLGARVLFLEVASDNTGAQRLYLGAGFVQSGIRRGYYTRNTETVDAAILKKAVKLPTP